MTTPIRPVRTDKDVDEILRAWIAPGPRSLSEPTLQRALATVQRTRQVPAWRARTGLGRGIQVARFAFAAAAVVLVTTVVLAWGAGRPTGIGGPPVTASASPLAAVPSPSPSTIASPSPEPRATPVVTGATLSGRVAATDATYQVRYPQVGGLADAAAAATINSLLRDQADAAVRDFTAGIGKDPQAGPDQLSTLGVDYSVAYGSPDVLSLRMNAYSYPSGAAHGADVLNTFTFELASGRRLALADLFRPGSGYLDALATEARAQLNVTLAGWETGPSMTTWLATGTEPTADNYAAWAITPGGLEITFGQYQVAPYAAGMPVVTIPIARLAAIIDPNGPFAPLLTRH